MEKNGCLEDALVENSELEVSKAESDRSSCAVTSFAAVLAKLNQASENSKHRFAEDNFSLEVNFGDGGSCQLSDVSSISCQNVTQDELDGLDCDSGTAAHNSLDSNSERSESPVEDFDNDRDEIEDAEFSSCLEAELRMKVAEQQQQQQSGIPVQAVQEYNGDISLYCDSNETGTMKRRFRVRSGDPENELSKCEMMNDCTRTTDFDWLLNCQGKSLADIDSFFSDDAFSKIVNIGQKGDDETDEGKYHYSPPVGLTTNGLTGSLLQSRTCSRSSSENCYVTLEYNKALGERSVPKIKKSPGVARRVGDVVNGNEDDVRHEEERTKISTEVQVMQSVASITNALEGKHDDVKSNQCEILEKVQPCDADYSGTFVNLSKPVDNTESTEEKSVCNGHVAVELPNCSESPPRMQGRNVDYTDHEDLLAELIYSAETLTPCVNSTVSGSTKVSEDMLTEISLNGSDLPRSGDCKTFSLSPEATDCDSADIASVLSEDVSGMPFVEDGLSSSQCSDADDTPKHTRKATSNSSKLVETAKTDRQIAASDSVSSCSLRQQDGDKEEECQTSKVMKEQSTGSSEFVIRKHHLAIPSSSIIDEEECIPSAAGDKTDDVEAVLEPPSSNQEETQGIEISTSLAELLKSPSLQKQKKLSDDDIEDTSPRKDYEKGISVSDKAESNELSPVSKKSQQTEKSRGRAYEGERESCISSAILRSLN